MPSTFLTIFFVSPISLWVRELNFCCESTMFDTSSLTVPLNCSSCLQGCQRSTNEASPTHASIKYISLWKSCSLYKCSVSLFDALHIGLVGEPEEEAGDATVHPAVRVPLTPRQQQRRIFPWIHMLTLFVLVFFVHIFLLFCCKKKKKGTGNIWCKWKFVT